MSQASAYLKLLRPGNCVMAAIACYIGYAVSANGLAFELPALYAMLAVFLVCGGGQAINDYFDRGVDKKLNPGKPIPSGKVPPKNALIFSLGLFVSGIMVSILFLPTASQLIAAGFTVLLIAYSGLLTKLKYLGNWVVALGTAFTFVFGASITGQYFPAIQLAATALLANLGRETTKDLEDLAWDKGFKVSLPMLVSKKSAKMLVALFYVSAIAIAFYVWGSMMITGFGFMIFLVFSLAGFAYSWMLLYQEKYGESQRYSKYAMALAMLGFIAGIM